jgi:hypothetical protein
VIPTFDLAAVAVLEVPVIVVFLFYDAANPSGGVFDEFDAIQSITDNTRTQSYSSITQETFGGEYPGFRWAFRTATFPSIAPTEMQSFYNQSYDVMQQFFGPSALTDLIDFRFSAFAPQPVTTLVALASKKAGGNALGLDPDHGDKIFIEFNLGWISPLCDKCVDHLKGPLDAMHDLHVSKFFGQYPTNYKSGSLSDIRYDVSLQYLIISAHSTHQLHPSFYERRPVRSASPPELWQRHIPTVEVNSSGLRSEWVLRYEAERL